MMDMQSLQRQGEDLLRRTLAFDQRQIHAAFADITRLQDFHTRIRLFTGVSALILVMVISLWLSRGLLQSLKELSTGLDRFSEGNFQEPIKIVSNDEIADVAREANHMAVQIKSLMKELESFSYSVAHDLRTPLRSILAYSNILLEDHASHLPEEARDPLNRISRAAKKMGELIDSLLAFSRLTRQEMSRQTVDLSVIAENILVELKREYPLREVEVKIKESVEAKGDPQLLQIVLANLLGNAWKYTSKKERAYIEFGVLRKDKENVYFIKDNGVGFDMKFYNKLFGTFQRLHSANEFEGTGIGLAMVQNIIHRHGGRIWAESETDHGAIFYFTLA
jgi:light-regulated signal transduction histidine kinase (bacteriophytochrome)